MWVVGGVLLPQVLCRKCRTYIDVQGADPEVGVQPCDCLELVASKPERLQVHLQNSLQIAASFGDML